LGKAAAVGSAAALALELSRIHLDVGEVVGKLRHILELVDLSF
jgi:hypothetical protein